MWASTFVVLFPCPCAPEFYVPVIDHHPPNRTMLPRAHSPSRLHLFFVSRSLFVFMKNFSNILSLIYSHGINSRLSKYYLNILFTLRLVFKLVENENLYVFCVYEKYVSTCSRLLYMNVDSICRRMSVSVSLCRWIWEQANTFNSLTGMYEMQTFCLSDLNWTCVVCNLLLPFCSYVNSLVVFYVLFSISI